MSQLTDSEANSPALSGVDDAPGTVLLEEVNGPLRHGKDQVVILQPPPSRDPNDPLNWSMTRKLVNFFITAFYAMMIFAILDIGPVVWQNYNEDLGLSYALLNNGNASMLAGLSVGCLLIIPFALKFGRRPVYIISTLVCMLCAIWQAVMRSYASYISANLISGLAGAVSETLVQMTVADLFFVHQRATMNAIYLLFLNTGGFAAPVAAGFIADGQGWHWIWWWSSIFLGVNLILFVFVYEETKYTVIQVGTAMSAHFLTESPQGDNATNEQAAQTHEKESSNSVALDRTTTHSIDMSIPKKTYRERMALVTNTPGTLKEFLRHLYQPLIVLCTLPAVTYTAVQYGAALSWYSIIGTSSATYFPAAPYNFGTVGIGLLNLPPFIGCALSAIFAGPLSDWSIQVLAKRNKGIYEPEMRLYLITIPTLLVPLGIFIYGYSVANGDHWIVPCVGYAIFAFGNASIYGLSLTYLVDCYREITGDALVSVAFIRNGFSSGITYAIAPWIAALGFHDTFTSAGCLALAVALLCVPMIIWGKRMRIARAEKYKYFASRQFDLRRAI